jgi:cyclic beta-1,2-glucan synthetase
VGEGGTGESVWLSWFLAHALHRMIPVAKARVDRARANRWRAHLARISQAIEADGWDGSYYRRGYYDDGTPLGSKDSEECRIDSIAQSWSVLSGQGDGARSRDALDQVMAQLVDRDAGIVKLFTPPFSDTPMEPGYIKGYPPGVRENGGQYTHASAWVVYALAMIGRGDDAKACFDMLNPVNHALSREAAQTYRVEPYVAAADIYAGAANIGRGGWTWYTGSAGWLYRAGVEAILGIRKRGDKLFVTPSLPGDWDGYTATLRIEGRSYRIVVKDGTVQVNETVVSPEDGYPLI